MRIMTDATILVLYNQPQSTKDHPASESEHMVVEIAQFMAETLKALGYRTSLLGLGPEPDVLWRELKSQKPDAVLNLYEGTLDDAESETYVACLLNWSGIPYTGCPPQTLSLARAKHLTKLLLKGAGLPTADFMVVTGEPIPECRLSWPVIVKPAAQDASVGIEHASVCQNHVEMAARVRHVLDTYGGPVLVEEFIAGRELMVALVALPELKALPPAEVLFRESRPGAWPILTYSGKWKPGHEDYDTTPPKYPADIGPDLAARLGDIAMQAFRLVGCRDYARVDFRVNARNQPFILEINPNPEVSDDACFGYILKSAGIDFADFLKSLIEQTLQRSPK
jgi:D-alanine-D-alanine ligase